MRFIHFEYDMRNAQLSHQNFKYFKVACISFDILTETVIIKTRITKKFYLSTFLRDKRCYGYNCDLINSDYYSLNILFLMF